MAHELGKVVAGIDCLLGVFERREQPANEVYVTGTFDDWAKSVRLEKKRQDLFEKVVELPQTEENIYYKVGIRLAFRYFQEWAPTSFSPSTQDSSLQATVEQTAIGGNAGQLDIGHL